MPVPAPFRADPVTPSVIRDRLMASAGITPEVQAKLLRRAVNTALRKLKAKKTITASFEGEIIDTLEVDDNMAQLRASEILIDLLGAKPSRDSNATVKVKVDVNLPDWAKPVDVSIIGGEVSDAETVDIPPTSE